MVKGLAKAVIVGNVTQDPELRTTTSGSKVCSFSIAVNRSYKSATGENREQVSYINCVAWSKAAEVIAQYIKKGSPLLVSGRLDQRSWEDKNTGQKRSTVEVTVEDFTFLGGDRNAENTSNDSSNTASSAANNTEDVIPEDIPDGEEVNLEDIPF